MALLTVSDELGVSVSISTNYLLPIPEGDSAIIRATVQKLGSNLCTMTCDIVRGRDGKLAAQGSHVKFVQPRSNGDQEKRAFLELLRLPKAKL